jgi:hypothetical protein
MTQVANAYRASSFPLNPVFEALVDETNQRNADKHLAVILQAHEASDPKRLLDLRKAANQSFIERIRRTHRVVLVTMNDANIFKALQKAKELGNGRKITVLCIESHGSKYDWQFHANESYTTERVAQGDFSLLERDSLVISFSCRAGRLGGIAQRLSEIRPDLLVVAPSSRVYYQIALRKKNILHVLQFDSKGEQTDCHYREGRLIERYPWPSTELVHHGIQLMHENQCFGTIHCLGQVFWANSEIRNYALSRQANLQAARAGYWDARHALLSFNPKDYDAETQQETFHWALELEEEYERQGLAYHQGFVAYEIGARYQRGQGVELNLHSTATWYQKSNMLGYVPAAVALGYLYEKGLGVPCNRKRAEALYEEAAQKGDSDARYRLEALRAKAAITPAFPAVFPQLSENADGR